MINTLTENNYELYYLPFEIDFKNDVVEFSRAVVEFETEADQLEYYATNF